MREPGYLAFGCSTINQDKKTINAEYKFAITVNRVGFITYHRA